MIYAQKITLTANTAALICRGRGDSEREHNVQIRTALTDVKLGGSASGCTYLMAGGSAVLPQVFENLLLTEDLYAISAGGGDIYIIETALDKTPSL